MHFDGRTRRALDEAGLSADEIASISDRVADLTGEDADALRAFFADEGSYYSDMELAHSTAEIQEHPTVDVEIFTHGSDLRGYLSLDGWGVPIEDGRVLRSTDRPAADGPDGGGNGSTRSAPPTLVELTLGDTINARVQFARNRERI